MRRLTATWALLPALALGQTPEVAPFVELYPTWVVRSGSQNVFGWNDIMGRYSIVGFRMMLETGNRVYVSQRLERPESNGDPDSVEEYFVESRGRWRIGKQYLPFGQRRLLRETVLAARLDTELVFDALPLAIAAYDAGSGRNRGVVFRIGGPFGVSIATGDHFAIQDTSLTMLQDGRTAPGRGRGYGLVYGADFAHSVGSAFFTLEVAVLRDGETLQDRDREVSELRAEFKTPGSKLPVALTWTRDWNANRDRYLATFDLPFDRRTTFRLGVRTQRSRFNDFFFTMGIKL